MINSFIKLNNNCKFLLFLFLIFGYQYNYAQIYLHNFDANPINSHPYLDAPTILNANLTNSSWTNTTSAWSNGTGNTGNALRLTCDQSPASTTISLTFNVATNYQVAVTSFDFWRQRSNTGAQNWAMKINGIDVGNGNIPTAGAAIGVTNVANSVAGLTGTVTVQLILSGATGTGTFRLDDFTLNGTVITTCVQPTIASFFPTNGPRNTVVAITGNGFQAGTGTSSVKFNGFEATSFNVLSNTLLEAVVPTNATTGNISITTNNCTGLSTSPFTIINSTYNIVFSTDIYISEIYDAQVGDGGIFEIYNGTAVAKDLTNYTLERYLNIGDATPNYSVPLTGILQPGQIYLVGIGSVPCGITPDITYATGFNANDEFKLLNNSVVIDNVQAPNEVGYTIIRSLTAIAPKPVFDANDWTITSTEDCAGIGVNAPTTTIPIASVNPLKVTICENESTTFTTTLNAGLIYTYQWKVLTAANTWVNVTNNANYSGATAYQLTINNPPAAFNKNQYYCEVNSSSFKIISNAVQLLVSPKPTAPTLSDTQPTCTTATGSITVTTPALGTGFTYSIDGTNFQVSNDFLSLAPNTYNISVKNAAGCISPTTQKIINAVPSSPSAPILADTQPTCTTATGSITVTTPALGTGFTYSIDGTNFQVSNEFLSLAPNTYNISVKNAAGCISSTSQTIINAVPSSPSAPILADTQPTCATATGSITVTTPALGTGFTYSIDGTNFQVSNEFLSLAPNTYNISVKNAAGCISPTTQKIINAVPSSPSAPILADTQPTCTTATGSITVTTPALGTGFTYSIDGTNFQVSNEFLSLAPNTYNISVKNAAGCISPTSQTIINSVPSSPSAPILAGTQPTCTSSTGSITVTNPALGTGFTYSIDGTNFQVSNEFLSLAPNTYNVYVKNAAGCISLPKSEIINAVSGNPAAPDNTIVQPTCTTSTGSITVTNPALGTGFTYSIDGTNFQVSNEFLSLAPNTYNIYVKNAAGCISLPKSEIINAVPGTPNVSGTTFNQTDCTAKLIGNSTNLGVDITWNGPGLTTNSANPAIAQTSGTYTVTVFDPTSGCSSSENVIVAIPNAPNQTTITILQPTCINAFGKIEITTPLAPDLTYSIDNINYQSSPIFNNLASGSYDVTARNAFGCTSTILHSVVTSQPLTPGVPNLSTIQPNCTNSTGSILVTSPIGIGFTFSIDGINYQVTSIPFSGLIPNTYPVTLKNADGCISAVTQVTINSVVGAPNAPTLELMQPTCTTATGSIKVTNPDFGTGFTYSIDGINFQVSNEFLSLAPNTYNISVKDTGGCTSPTTQAIISTAPTFPDKPTIKIIQPTCTNVSGTIEIKAPFAADLTYSIDNTNYQASPIFDNLISGNYFVTARNGFGCTSTIEIGMVNNPPAVPIAAILTSTDPTCLIDKGTIQVTDPLGADLTYSIDGVNFQASTTFSNLDPDDYTIVVKNNLGCISIPTTITINPVPQAPSSRDIYYYCVDENDLVISPARIDTGLSILNYSFSWTFNGTPISNTDSKIDADQVGIYRVLATNLITGCEVHLTGDVKKSSPAIATATVGIDFDYAQTIMVNISNGIGDYLYQLNDGPFQESNIFKIYSGGINTNKTYTITIQDKNGCNDFVFDIDVYNFPRYFSPNGDGFYDTWNIKEIPTFANSTIYIFDRMGKLLKQISPTGDGWDGTFASKPLPASDYWFILKYQDTNGIQKEFKSHFALKR